GVRAGAGVLVEIGRRAQPPVLADRQDRHAAAGVVGDEDAAPGPIHAQVAGVVAAGGLAVEVGQVPGGRVDREGADGPAGPAVDLRRLVGGVEVAPAGIGGEE